METCAKNLEKFVEYDQCLDLIRDLNTKLEGNIEEPNLHSQTEQLVEKFRKTIDKYQEQPELLEPYLPELIQRLTLNLPNQNGSCDRYHTTFKFLYQLIKVMGFKAIGKRFPHETDKLPLLVGLLEAEDPQDKLNWQTRYVLTVWLSIAILAPFDLAKFDSDSSKPTMAERIYSALKKSLSSHDSCQHVTSYCLAKFFSRPDMLMSERQLTEFVTEALGGLNSVKGGLVSSTDDVKLIGDLRTFAYMFKFLPRVELKKRYKQILESLIRLDIEKINRELIKHHIIKLLQRVGLTLLPKRVALWRYKRGSRILGQSGKARGGAQAQGPTSQLVADDGLGALDDDDGEELDSTECLELILSQLLVAAQDAQTRIRWSAAKGIARLTSRLSRGRAADVIDMVLANFFGPTSSEYAWHGGTLALAEMSRQGSILEEKLSDTIEIISNAIVYDKIKGSFAVGSHVREAACYVLWAMSRTYEDHLLAPYISSISVNLLCTMLFDREVQCRRAASATFQELVGRQGTFNEEGINILTSADYQSVGVRQFAYLDLALQVARQGDKYHEPFVRHLIANKIGHWDINIRRLASDSLSALMLYPSHDFIRASVLSPLSQMIEQDVDNNQRHGAILSLAKVMKGVVPLNFEFGHELIALTGSVAKKCDKQLKSKQQAPNFIEALANVIISAEVAKFNYGDNETEILTQWESIILTALNSDNANLRDIGSEALLALYKFFYGSNKTCQDRLLTTLNKSLNSMNESTRCGALRALSKLGATISSGFPSSQGGESNIRLDADTPDIILMSMTRYISKETKERPPDGSSGFLVFAQAKAESCEAFVNFVKSMDKSRLVGCLGALEAGLDALLEKTEDYTFDRRGDIGVLVRKAAVKGLHELTLFLAFIGMTSLLEPNRVSKIIARILQQAISYHDSARELAARTLYQLVEESNLPDGSIPHRAEILSLFERYQVDEAFNWRDDSTPIFVSLLEQPEYSSDLWLGLLPAVGQMSDMCAKQFRLALKKYLKGLYDRPKERREVFESFLATLERPQLPQRLISSGLIVVDFLQSSGLLEELDADFEGRLANFCELSRAKVQPELANFVSNSVKV